MGLWFCLLRRSPMGIHATSGGAHRPNPLYGLRYLLSNGYASFVVLGGVFLCVTGAEALYAEHGAFRPPPIRLAWSVVVFPSLILNYAGQSAIVLDGASTSDNIFYRLCPEALLIPFMFWQRLQRSLPASRSSPERSR